MSNAEAAIAYRERGWAITPIRPLSKKPYLPGWWERGLKITADMAEAIWAGDPDQNIGLLTGYTFDALDIDGPEGRESLNRHLLGHPYKHTGPIAHTGGGGWHFYFKATGAGNRIGMLTKVDYRGTDGQVVAPPSRSDTGIYWWIGNDGLIWPHRDARIWPHPRPVH